MNIHTSPHLRTAALGFLLGLLSVSALAQGVYRIVGPDGRVSYSDQPPPAANARPVAAGAPGAAGGSARELITFVKDRAGHDWRYAIDAGKITRELGYKPHESFETGLLEYPHYTRPAEFQGLSVPAVLRSGDHAAISRWRSAQQQQRTRERRPDLWAKWQAQQ